MVPQGFQFPKGAQLKTMWDLWFYGHGDLKIRPYKELERYLDDLQTAAEKVRFSRTKTIMSIMLEVVREKAVMNVGEDGRK